MLHKILLPVIYILVYFPVFAQCNDAVRTGEATFYGGIAGSSGGNCSLPVDANDFMHCALNNTDYNNSNACGACLEVTGSRGKTIVKVVDRCPECKPGDVDLTQQAFSEIANPIDGRVPISWKFVPCPLASNQTIKVNFKSGSSKYWTAIQFRNIKHAINKMEYFKNGTWINVKRELFNFFIEPTGVESPMNLRITSVVGETLLLNNIEINTNTDFDTGLQFTTPQGCDTTIPDPTPNENQAFKPHKIPGRIEAEDFDKGGQNNGYNDTDTTNRGRQYRNEGVDIQTTGDLNGNYNVGWTTTNEWLEYTVNITATGSYDFVFRTASIFSTSSFQLLVDGSSIRDQVSVPNTNAWQSYTDINVPNIVLTEGVHTFRIFITGSGFNLNYWSGALSGSNRNSSPHIPEIKGYPNPTSSTFYIQDPDIKQWKVIDMSGKIILKGKENTINLSSFKNGNYFLITKNKALQIIKK